MKKAIICILIIITFSVFLCACVHVDALAQAAAADDLIDHDTANMISLSARAFGSAAENISLEEEYFIGRAVAANILTTYKIWNEKPELTAYLNKICAALVLNSPQPKNFKGYFVAMLDSDEINAFATSGGHIFVTRGLVGVAKTEDALASVIAHEIAHCQLRHGIKSIKSSRMTQAILFTATTGIGNAMGMDINELSDVLTESVGEIVQTMVNKGYSKEQEYEADIAAMYFLAVAGYQPSAIIDMLKGLEAVQTVRSGFHRTHPLPVQRIYYAQRALNRFQVEDTSQDRQERFTRLRIDIAAQQAAY